MNADLLLRRVRLSLRGELVDILVRGGVIAAVGSDAAERVSSRRVSPPATGLGGTRGGPSEFDAAGALVVPGFVDLHNHGGGGAAIYTGLRADVEAAASFHLRHGTTSMLASVAAMPLERMEAAAATIAAVIDSGRAPNIRGIHFEGPFLSPLKAGAQASDSLLQPAEDVFSRLRRAAGRHLVQMTIAPELPGALELIRRYHDEVIFAVGHSAATAREAHLAFDAGARQVTHLFNALTPFSPREPGAAVRALLDDRVTLEVIGDGIHLADDTLRLVFAVAGGRIAAVTDCNAAAGLSFGHHEYADRVVDVDEHGRATITGTQTLAGSTIPLGVVFGRLVREVGIPVRSAVRATSETAAAQLNSGSIARIAPGERADLVVLDGHFDVAHVVFAGRMIAA